MRGLAGEGGAREGGSSRGQQLRIGRRRFPPGLRWLRAGSWPQAHPPQPSRRRRRRTGSAPGSFPAAAGCCCRCAAAAVAAKPVAAAAPRAATRIGRLGDGRHRAPPGRGAGRVHAAELVPVPVGPLAVRGAVPHHAAAGALLVLGAGGGRGAAAQAVVAVGGAAAGVGGGRDVGRGYGGVEDVAEAGGHGVLHVQAAARDGGLKRAQEVHLVGLQVADLLDAGGELRRLLPRPQAMERRGAPRGHGAGRLGLDDEVGRLHADLVAGWELQAPAILGLVVVQHMGIHPVVLRRRLQPAYFYSAARLQSVRGEGLLKEFLCTTCRLNMLVETSQLEKR